MNRIIKFRGKRVNGGEWVESMTISNGTIKRKAYKVFFEISPNKWVGVIPQTVGQFTGLLDKNGKEIYEGDIVKSNLTIGMPNTGCNHNIGDLFVIVCMLSGYTLMAMRDYRYEGRREVPSLAWNLNNYFLWNYHNKFEVIGTIHDNPELLEGGKE